MVEPVELISIQPSTRKHKKWKAIFIAEDDDGQQSYKTIHFGDSRYDDYTIHKDPVRMESYRRRHKSALKASPMSANALSYFLLWGNSTDLETNIEFFKEHFNL